MHKLWILSENLSKFRIINFQWQLGILSLREGFSRKRGSGFPSFGRIQVRAGKTMPRGGWPRGIFGVKK
jgi:hypothetical protein